MTHATPEERAAAERQAAAQIMDNLRTRGLITTPAPAPEHPAAALIDEALQEAHTPAARLYPTAEQLDIWAANPGAMTDEHHAAFCQGGYLVAAGTDASRKCPRCSAEAEAQNLRQRLINSGIDGRYLDVTWADLEQPAPLDRLAQACERITEIVSAGHSVLLWSEETGSGKTQAAMLAASAAVQAGRTAHVTNLARLAVEIRDGYGDRTGAALKEGQALQRLTTPDVLVIDDLGAGETDSAAVERRLLFLALDQRQMHRRTTIVTTNLTPQELATTFGARILARLQPLTTIHINHGKNFRSPKGTKSLW